MHVSHTALNRYRRRHGGDSCSRDDVVAAVRYARPMTAEQTDYLRSRGGDSSGGCSYRLAADKSGAFVIRDETVLTFLPLLRRDRRALGLPPGEADVAMHDARVRRRAYMRDVCAKLLSVEPSAIVLKCRMPRSGRGLVNRESHMRGDVWKAFTRMLREYEDDEDQASEGLDGWAFAVEGVGDYTVSVRQKDGRQVVMLSPVGICHACDYGRVECSYGGPTCNSGRCDHKVCALCHGTGNLR